jgi:transcription factor SPN1
MENLEEEIFGADSDQEEPEKVSSAVQDNDDLGLFDDAPSSAVTSSSFRDDNDDLFFDSDDENAVGASRKNKLKKGSGSVKRRTVDDENLMDSDDDDFQARQQKKDKKLSRKEGKEGKIKKRKHSEREREERREKKRSKLAGGNKEKGGVGGEGGEKPDVSSGDEYDSGEEVVENEEDRNFIDEDDDLKDVRNEYDDDDQNFDDERPDHHRPGGGGGKSGGKKSSSSSASSSSSYVSKSSTKDQDPLSQTLSEIRKPKLKALTDAEKDQMIDKLLKQMTKAQQLDDECFKAKKPAIYKLQLLPAVQRAVSMKQLHNTLLEKDFLWYLRDWIEPKNATTLPALSLRTSIYEMLLKLPIMTEHLKRGKKDINLIFFLFLTFVLFLSFFAVFLFFTCCFILGNDKGPIGYIIVSLRKHKMETPENKRLLKEIMDKWSRPIFSSRDSGGASENGLTTMDNEEIRDAIMRKYANIDSNNALASASSPAVLSLISGQGTAANQKQDSDYSQRARAPRNNGYIFTVQPELKSIDKRNVMEKQLGEERMRLFKKMTEGGKSSSTGKKTNTQ